MPLVTRLFYNLPPPRSSHSKYDDSELIGQLLSDIEYIALNNARAIISIIGDVNHLNVTRFETEAGMIQLVQEATHGKNVLDKFITNRPDLFDVKVTVSSIKTKHEAVTANLYNLVEPAAQGRKSVKFSDIRQPHIQSLRDTLSRYNWGAVLKAENNMDVKYNLFHEIITKLIEMCIPTRTITMRKTEPWFITPLIKSLLR